MEHADPDATVTAADRAKPSKRRRNRPRRITIWNLCALLVLLLGGAVTLGAGYFWLDYWADTGVHIPIGVRHTVELPYGTTTLYYETGGNVPARNPLIKIRDPYGAWITPAPPPEAENFRMMFTGWSGRAVGRLVVDEEGSYTLLCNSPDAFSNEEIPVDDRLTMLKQPDTLSEARTIHKAILVTGASITILITLICYTLHLVTLHRRTVAHQSEHEQ